MTTTTSVPPPLHTRDPLVITSSDRALAALCHASIWLNLLVFGLGFLVPLIIFLVMRDQSRFVADNAKEVLNFQISALLYLLCSIPLFLVVIGVAIMLGVMGLSLICPLIGTIRAADGTLALYPFTIRFI